MHNESLHGIGGKLPRLPVSSGVMQKKIHPQMRKGRKEDAKRVIKDRGGLAFDRG